MIDIKIHEVSDKQLPFIHATWLHSYKHASYFAKRIRSTIFFQWHNKIITRILDRPNTKVLLASPKDDLDVILGYLIYEAQPESPVIHYAYVKKNFRRFGIAKEMIAASGIKLSEASFDHWSFDTDWIIQKIPDLTYNPYLI